MAPAGRRAADRRKEMTLAETRIKKISMKRPALQWGRNWQPAMYLFSKFARFSGLRGVLLRRRSTSNKEQQGKEVVVVKEVEPIKDLKKECQQMDHETDDIIFFWRDPDANFCTICGDAEENHLELMCPYNYLCPTAYAPCRARLLLWGIGMPEYTPRPVRFLRRFVRMNNIPARCCPDQVVSLFKQFGPLQMWHVTLRKSGGRRGFGYVIFMHREHAEEAIEALNCYSLCGCKLRVDWAYTSI